MQPLTYIEGAEYKIETLKEDFYPYFDEVVEFCNFKKITNITSADKSTTFSFVGILIQRNFSILFLPKYFNDTQGIDRQYYLKLLLRVLEKYQKVQIKKSIESIFKSEEESFLNLFGTVGFLLKNYIEYGLYLKEENEQVENGTSEIDWQSTIDLSTAHLTPLGAPVYLSVIHDELEDDWFSNITEIHKSVINECSRLLNQWQIGDILGWPKVYTEVSNNWLSKPDEAIYWIENSLKSEFQDSKLLVLKNLLFFIKEVSSMNFKQDSYLIGSKYFQGIWERCCGEVLGHNFTLQEEVPRPVWESKFGVDISKKPLQPDLLRHIKNDYTNSLIIFDAKYYAIEFLGNHVENNPGVGDLTKQYMYHNALTPYICNQKIDKVYNAFLFPSLKDVEDVFGIASFSFLPKLPGISLIHLNAEEIYKMYLSGTSWSETKLRGLLDQIDSY